MMMNDKTNTGWKQSRPVVDVHVAGGRLHMYVCTSYHHWQGWVKGRFAVWSRAPQPPVMETRLLSSLNISWLANAIGIRKITAIHSLPPHAAVHCSVKGGEEQSDDVDDVGKLTTRTTIERPDQITSNQPNWHRYCLTDVAICYWSNWYPGNCSAPPRPPRSTTIIHTHMHTWVGVAMGVLSPTQEDYLPRQPGR